MNVVPLKPVAALKILILTLLMLIGGLSQTAHAISINELLREAAHLEALLPDQVVKCRRGRALVRVAEVERDRTLKIRIVRRIRSDISQLYKFTRIYGHDSEKLNRRLTRKIFLLTQEIENATSPEEKARKIERRQLLLDVRRELSQKLEMFLSCFDTLKREYLRVTPRK